MSADEQSSRFSRTAVDEPRWMTLTPDLGAAFMAIERVEMLLRKFTAALDGAGVPYAIVGGNAVAAWVSTVDRDATRTTKDVDVLLRRADLGAAAAAVDPAGLYVDEIDGVTMFLEKNDPAPRRAVHIVFADEPIRPPEPELAPSVSSSCRSPDGYQVVSLPSLLRMKLFADRLLDRVHVQDMLEVGLIDASVAAQLPDDLRARLREIRDAMQWRTQPSSF